MILNLKKIVFKIIISIQSLFSVKNIAIRENDFNYDIKHSFYRFYKEYNEFEEISLDTKYNKIKKIIELFTIFKNLKQKNPKTQLKKERIMKNVDELYEKNFMITKMILTMMMG